MARPGPLLPMQVAPPRSGVVRTAVLLLVLLGALPEVRARGSVGGAVASESPEATRAAVAQLRAGGNAVDAAVTLALVAGVTHPSSSGIGGGGFALLWLAQQQKTRFFDFRELAPAGVDLVSLEERPLPPQKRGQLVGVPGEVAGLYGLHRAFGVRSWHDVVVPAVELAREGFRVDPYLARVLLARGRFEARDPGLMALYFPHGKPLGQGQRVVARKLAETLQRILDQGPAGFYRGATADDLVETAKRAGGALGQWDLAHYRPIERAPLCVGWEGREVCTAPAPSGGGLLLLQVLGQFGQAELRRLGYGSGAYQHLLAESMRGAMADRALFVGDPAFVPDDTRALLDPARLRARREHLHPHRTRTIGQFALGGGTHHMVTADHQGNVVSLTTTVNHAFGAELSGLVSGVVLNDELDDFTLAREARELGVRQSPNRPRPGARPVSSMTPTLVTEAGRVVLALGGSGGTTIPTSVTQALLHRLVFAGTPAQVVRASRFYLPTPGATLWLEQAPPPALAADLTGRGEQLGAMPYREPAVQLIARERDQWVAAADPRKHGAAATR